ncbi:uncharacterized protein LAESUDRAFT_726239 [Laetiporus sulphureus 93-53]|uniref:Uncharacterized protein n=1 Tax=Laetiporus sulphureus 93-53 TaxID=1314785 RepID=A0A165E0Z3_9APHY|nr:uncharacterized protein LAESUDRAFT_726239 [Laetiporus sulphureus 93-53]KZT06037.1 hypothetical protein LAESUDRAFT_726239 [Laetiporus sulphureus 93-53]
MSPYAVLLHAERTLVRIPAMFKGVTQAARHSHVYGWSQCVYRLTSLQPWFPVLLDRNLQFTEHFKCSLVLVYMFLAVEVAMSSYIGSMAA